MPDAVSADFARNPFAEVASLPFEPGPVHHGADPSVAHRQGPPLPPRQTRIESAAPRPAPRSPEIAAALENRRASGDAAASTDAAYSIWRRLAVGVASGIFPGPIVGAGMFYAATFECCTGINAENGPEPGQQIGRVHQAVARSAALVGGLVGFAVGPFWYGYERFLHPDI